MNIQVDLNVHQYSPPPMFIYMFNRTISLSGQRVSCLTRETEKDLPVENHVST